MNLLLPTEIVAKIRPLWEELAGTQLDIQVIQGGVFAFGAYDEINRLWLKLNERSIGYRSGYSETRQAYYVMSMI